MRSGRADPQHALVFADVIQIRNAADIDELSRRGQPEFHQRDQAHSTGQHFDVVAGQQAQRVLQTRRRGVLEILRNHAWPPA